MSPKPTRDEIRNCSRKPGPTQIELQINYRKRICKLKVGTVATAGATAEGSRPEGRGRRPAAAGWHYRDGTNGAEGQLDEYVSPYC